MGDQENRKFGKGKENNRTHNMRGQCNKEQQSNKEQSETQTIYTQEEIKAE